MNSLPVAEFDVSAGRFYHCPAPAKLNLFLHVTGRRADGYHLLETVFQLIDRSDLLNFVRRSDGEIVRTSAIEGVPAETDLVVRAAHLLKRYSGTPFGADIELIKNLPMGGGLGGGSSDAATTLIALNCLWDTRLNRQQLMDLGEQLGADVPFFLFGQNAFARGIGEQLTTIPTPECSYVVIEPGVQIPTPVIFSAKTLTRDSPSIKVSDFHCYPHGNFRNDLQDVAVELFPEVSFALKWLSHYGNAKMTGSGSCVFCPCENESAADQILDDVSGYVGKTQINWTAWKAKSLTEHPMNRWITS